MIIKMLKELRRRVNEQNEKVEVFNKELENMKKIQRWRIQVEESSLYRKYKEEAELKNLSSQFWN